MPEYKTGSWTVTTNDHGDVIDARSPAHTQGGQENRALIIQALNEDVVAGIAPRDITTWGHEYKEVFNHRDGSWYWLSYLQLVWYSVDQGVSVDKRRERAKRLEDILDTLITNNTGAGRIRTGVFRNE